MGLRFNAAGSLAAVARAEWEWRRGSVKFARQLERRKECCLEDGVAFVERIVADRME